MDATTQRTLSAIWGKRPLESDGGGKSGEEPASKRPAAAVAAVVVVTWPRADAWDDRHVRLACSPRNGTADGRRKWPEIAATLRALTPTAEGLCDAIFAVNASYRGSWDLSGLTRFFARDGAGGFDGTLLLRMADAALRLPALCGDAPLPLLRKGRGGVVVLTQAQIVCLLCNAFFCTFPRRNEPISAQSEYKNFPSINFTTLFRLTTPPCKLRFLLHYFDRVTSAALGDASSSPLNGGCVVFERRVLAEAPDWKTSAKRLCEVVATSDGVIEDDAPGHRHVDFANKRLGGGVLGHGAVQEEIMFLTHPELIVARLLCEELGDSEAVIVRGAERFSRYRGYSRELEYAGDFRDLTPFNTDHVWVLRDIAALLRNRVGASASFDGTATLWDDSGAKIAVLRQPSARHLVACSAVPGKPETLYTAGSLAEVAAWDVSTKALKSAFTLSRCTAITACKALASSSAAAVVACGTATGEAIVWDPSSCAVAARFCAHLSVPVNAVASPSDGKPLVATASENVVRIWDLRNHTFPVHRLCAVSAKSGSSGVSGLAWGEANPGTIAAVTRNGEGTVWCTATGEVQNRTRFGGTPLCLCAVSGADYAVGFSSGSLLRWDSSIGSASEVSSSSQSAFFGVWAASHSNGFLATGSSSGMTTLWDVSNKKKWQRVGVVSEHASFVEDVQFLDF